MTQTCTRNTPFSIAKTAGILNRIAACTELTTKTAVRLAIREAGLPGRPEFVEAVFEKREEHVRLRKTRLNRRIEARTGETPPQPVQTPSNTPVLLPAGAPQQRLAKRRRGVVKGVAFALFRYGAAGGTTFSVRVTDVPEEMGYRVDIGQNWDTYRGRFKGWKATEDHHTVTLPAQWMTRIHRRGLAALDGLMTLEAQEVLSGDPSIDLFKAVWARQGRGYAVVTERGCIARSGNICHHAETAEQALAGLRRKLASIGRPARSAESSLTLDEAGFINRYRRHRCMVSLDDARESGSCETGILGWCERVGIDPNRGAIPLAEALEAFSRAPLIEVRLAVMHAVRAHRRMLRESAQR